MNSFPKGHLPWVFSLLLALVVGCQAKHSAGDEPSAHQEAPSSPSLSPAIPAPLASPAVADSPEPPQAQIGPPAATTRLLIYHADVRLKTSDMPRAAIRLDSLVRRSGGYLSAATETRADGEWRQENTIRVPPAQFRPLLSGLAGLGTVEEKKLSTDDVTAEHADVAARLQAKRAVERQYVALLRKAQKIKDILDIEEKLGEAREEIEATESRLKSLNDEVAYSTITLTLYQPLPQAVPDAPVVSLGSRTVAAIYEGWEFFLSLGLGLLSLWPLVLLAGTGAAWWRRRRATWPRPAPPTPAS